MKKLLHGYKPRAIKVKIAQILFFFTYFKQVFTSQLGASKGQSEPKFFFSARKFLYVLRSSENTD